MGGSQLFIPKILAEKGRKLRQQNLAINDDNNGDSDDGDDDDGLACCAFSEALL